MWCVGINAVGFDLDAKSGRNGSGYTQPSQEALRYFHDQGANCFRLPMTWERMQSVLGATTLDLVDGIDDTVAFITQNLSSHVIIDPHNNDQGLQYNGINANRQDFVNLWHAAAIHWKQNDKVIFGLYNEPRYGTEAGIDGYFDPDALDFDGTMIQYWLEWMQEAINAIRVAEANQLILVPGLHWTGSRDWSGAHWWGETLDGVPRAGNTRLALLTDPQDMIAYDVHQYMDPKFTGEAAGCEGHRESYFGGPGADWGLNLTIAWAQRYNKKLMMTEIGSYPTFGSTDAYCNRKLGAYLQQMHDSGVFLGYQVWQFGCPQCLADQWTNRPYNLDWYRWGLYGSGGSAATCSRRGESCLETRCCLDTTLTCFEKDEHWASCRATCKPGVNELDPPRFQTPWTCTPLA